MQDRFLESTAAARVYQSHNCLITDLTHNIDDCHVRLVERIENLNGMVTSLLGTVPRLRAFLESINYKVWLCIACIGLTSAVIGVTADWLSLELFSRRVAFVTSFQRLDLQLGWWVLTCLLLALLSTAACGWLAPAAQGSGIPEVKTVLSGVNYFGFMTPNTMLAKFLGMILIQGAGFIIGFQGSMIQISAIVAEQMVRLPLFREFHNNAFVRRQLMNASVACGVVSTFGTPYGGILLSVELCSSVFLVSNLFKAFFCGSIAYVVFQKLNKNLGFLGKYQKETLTPTEDDFTFALIGLGLICGGLGAILVSTAGKLLQAKNSSKLDVFQNRYLYTTLTAIMVGTITFFQSNFWFANKQVLIDILQREDLSGSLASGMFGGDHTDWVLSTSICLRIAVFYLMVTTPTPNGVFAPAVLIGGLIGRLYADIGNSWFNLHMNPRVFSAAGAAALAGAVTRAASPILVILEMTREMEFLYGLIIATIVAYGLSGCFVVGFFDTVLNIRRLPYLPVLFSSTWYKQTALEFAQPCKLILAKNSNLVDLLHFVRKLKSETEQTNSQELMNNSPVEANRDDYVAVVETLDHPVLLGSVKLGAIFDFIVAEIQEIEAKLLSNDIAIKKQIQADLDCLKSDQAKEAHSFGDSHVVQINNQLLDYIQELAPTEPHIMFAEDGVAHEVQRLKPLNIRKRKNTKAGRNPSVNQTIDSIIDEIREQMHFSYVQDSSQHQLSRTSTKGNDNRYFQYFRQIVYRRALRFEHPTLEFNCLPSSVETDTPLIKVHYLFQSLGTSCVFVRGTDNTVKGVIRKQDFLALRYKLSVGR